MSLTVGTGPFGPRRGTLTSGDPPDHVLYREDWPRRMRAMFGGATVLDTRSGRLLHETGKLADHYYPMDQIRTDYIEPSDDRDHDEHKGESRHWHIRVGDRIAENAITEYASPPELLDWVTIEFSAMDRWFEEDEPIYAHPRDPYHRVDVRAASCHVVVRHGDVVVAGSTRPRLLFSRPAHPSATTCRSTTSPSTSSSGATPSPSARTRETANTGTSISTISRSRMPHGASPTPYQRVSRLPNTSASTRTR